jgi:4-hydroxybutyryl-CoA dehydratase/vinylacetyl-CoA-Delta-isomerase
LALKTPEEYKASLRAMRPNVYKFGQLIEDVTSHPSTRYTVEGHARIFAAQHEEEHRDIYTTTSHVTGEPISRYLSIFRSPEDMMANSRMKRRTFQLTGTCTGGRCAGWTAMNALFATTWDIDEGEGTDYHQRLLDWLKDAQARDITMAGALTDPKGDRTLAPHQQADPDMNLRIVERHDDGGLTVRGAKVMICGVAAANELVVMPGSAYGEADADWSAAFAIPRDAPGITIVEARHPSDDREAGCSCDDDFDLPVKGGGITQAYILFRDVHVPAERVFMSGEFKYTRNNIMYFIGPYRAAIGACVAGQGDVMRGAAALMARANGLDEKVFTDKLNQMAINNETTYGMGIASAVMGKPHPSGAWLCDPLLSNVNKVHVARLPYETKVLAQDIAGGVAETGCMPSYVDFTDDEYGELLQKYMGAAVDGETRARIARLVEWLTIGAGVPGCMHGGGSPDGAKLFVRLFSDLDGHMDLAKELAGLEAEVPRPEKRRRK